MPAGKRAGGAFSCGACARPLAPQGATGKRLGLAGSMPARPRPDQIHHRSPEW